LGREPEHERRERHRLEIGRRCRRAFGRRRGRLGRRRVARGGLIGEAASIGHLEARLVLSIFHDASVIRLSMACPSALASYAIGSRSLSRGALGVAVWTRKPFPYSGASAGDTA